MMAALAKIVGVMMINLNTDWRTYTYTYTQPHLDKYPYLWKIEWRYKYFLEAQEIEDIKSFANELKEDLKGDARVDVYVKQPAIAIHLADRNDLLLLKLRF